MFDWRDEEGLKQTTFLSLLAAHHSAISSNTHGVTSTTMVELARTTSTIMVELAHVPRRRRLCPPAHNAPRRRRVHPCATLCRHRARPCVAPPPSSPVRRLLASRHAIAELARAHRAAPPPSSPACPRAVSSPSSPALCRHRARLLTCEVCGAERAREQRREYTTSKWDKLVRPIFLG
jgi:hypothetical protein